MAKKNDIKGITIEIGGETTELTDALKGVDKQLKSTETDLKTVDRLLKLDPKNTELLAQKQKILNEDIDATKQKLEVLKKGKEAADEKMKDGTEESRKAFLHIQEEILNTEKRLKELEQSANKFTQAGEKMQSVGNKMSEIGQKGMALSGAITALGAGAAAAAESTRDYREDMARLDAAFVSTGKTTESARNAYHDFYLILGESDRSVEAVNHLAELCNSQEELSKWSDICAGISAKFGDSLPIEGLTEAANETAKVAQITGPLADAINWTAVNTDNWTKILGENSQAMKAYQKAIAEGESGEDAFNEALEKINTEQERSSLITQALADTYRGAGEVFKSMNADVIASREAAEEWNSAMADLGAEVEPILTSIKTHTAELLKWFNDLDGGQKKILATTLAIVAAVPPLLIFMGNTITSIGTLSTALGDCKGKVAELWAVMNAHKMVSLTSILLTVGGAIALVRYESDEATKKISKLTEETSRLTKEADDLIYSTDRTEKSFDVEKDTVDELINRLYDLEEQDGKTTQTKQEMHNIVDRLNSLIPDLNLSLNDETGELNMQRGVVQGLANDFILLAKAKALSQQLQEGYKMENELKINLQENTDARNELVEPYVNGQKRVGLGYLINLTRVSVSEDKSEKELKKVQEHNKKLEDMSNELMAQIGGNIDDLGSKGEKVRSKAAKSADRAAKSSKKSTKKAVDEMKKAFDQELKTLKEDLSYGFISQQEYYKKLAEIRDYYLKKGSSDWWTYTKEIIKYEKDKAEEIKKTMQDVEEKIQSTTENYVNQRKQLTEPFENALKDGSLYDTTILIDGDKKIEMQSLNDWTDEIEKINKFNDKISKTSERLKGFFGDDTEGLNEILNTFRASPYGEGGKLLDLINKADDKELKEYIEGFQKYNATAKSTAEASYSSEIAQLTEDYRKDIKGILDEIPDDFKNIGKAAGEYFAKGFTDEMFAVYDSIRKISQINLASLIHGGGSVSNNVSNNKTNNINVNVSDVGPVQSENQLIRRIANAIWLGGEF